MAAEADAPAPLEFNAETFAQAALGAAVLRAFAAPIDLSSQLQACARAIVDHIGAAFARVWTLDRTGNILELAASAGLYTHLDGDHARIPVGSFKIGAIAQSLRPHFTNDVLHDPMVSDIDWARDNGMVAFAGYPLVARGRLVGVVGLFARVELSPSVLESLSGIAEAIAVGIDQARVARDHERLLNELEEQRRLLEAVIQQMPAGVVIAEAPSGRLLLANQLAHEYEHPLVMSAPTGDENTDFALDVKRLEGWPIVDAIAAGTPVTGREIDHVLSDGTEIVVLASAAPVRDPNDRVIAAVGTMVDITSRRRAEQLLHLQHVATRTLADFASLDDAAGEMLRRLASVMHVAIAGLWLVDRHAHVLRNHGMWAAPDAQVGAFSASSRQRTFALGIGLPGRAWEQAKPVWVADALADSNFPRASAAQESDLHCGFAVPVIVADEVVAVFEFFRHDVQLPDNELLDVLQSVAGQFGQFLERVRVQDALRDSEARKASMLSSALDCVVAIDHEARFIEFNDAAERTFGYQRSEVLGERMSELIIPPRYRAAHDAGFEHYLATGEGPALGQRLELHAMRKDGSEFPVELAIVRIDAGPLAFTAYLRDITARQAAQAELVSSRERMAHLAETLQASLIPPAPPTVPKLDVASVYRPAGAGDEIGGDFYDVFETAPGDWAVVVGDVCGKGAEAAAVTALARYTTRATAMQTRKPKQVLSILNRAVLAQHPDRFCTVVYARLRWVRGHLRVTISSGGHPLPLRTNVDGEVSPVGRFGGLVGAFEDPPYHDTNIDLQPGESLVFFTDGVTEGRSGDAFYGEARLTTLLASLHGTTANTIAQRVLDDVVEFQNGHTRDDIAVVVLRAPESPDSADTSEPEPDPEA